MTDVETTLRKFGIGSRYRGFRQAVAAIELAVEDEDRLRAITKEIYCEVAHRLGCSWFSVERNIRTLITRIWSQPQSRVLLFRIAGYELPQSPTVSEFLDVFSNYIRRSRAAQSGDPLLV